MDKSGEDSQTHQEQILPGWWIYEWPIFENAARQLNPKRTVNPKKTTAFNRTQTVCIFLSSLYEWQCLLVDIRSSSRFWLSLSTSFQLFSLSPQTVSCLPVSCERTKIKFYYIPLLYSYVCVRFWNRGILWCAYTWITWTKTMPSTKVWTYESRNWKLGTYEPIYIEQVEPPEPMIFSSMIRYSLHICQELTFNTHYKSLERNLEELLNIRYVRAYTKRTIQNSSRRNKPFVFEPDHQMCETSTGTWPHSILSEFATPMQLQSQNYIHS